ncbi:MAG: DUF5655 domain-containing protein [Candidatus Berkelbacteria bacterium]|nr:DUF5655 domain-containing protein [Candidatus Berkelbacteria bacterium]
MAIFKINDQKLEAISEKKIDLERDIQKLTEQNLENVFGLKFVCGASNQEFCVRANEQDFYIDSVALDESTNSVVLIEYKKDRSFSVIDQGFAYLSAMLNNKAEFVLEINERLKKNLSKKDIDWEQSRIIFISNEFTNYQKNAINFKDLPMFLYEVKIYDNLIDYNPIKPFKTSESINKFIKDKKVREVVNEVKVYSIEDHLSKSLPEIVEIYNTLSQKIHSLDTRILEKPVRGYIGFKIRYHNFCSLAVQKNKIGVYLRAQKISDGNKLLKRIPSQSSLWRCDITSLDQIDEVFLLIQQSYNQAPDK